MVGKADSIGAGNGRELARGSEDFTQKGRGVSELRHCSLVVEPCTEDQDHRHRCLQSEQTGL